MIDADALRPPAGRLLPRRAAGPAGARELDHARRAAAARAPARDPRARRRGRCCASRCPARRAASGPRRATPPRRVPERRPAPRRGTSTRRCGSTRARTPTTLAGVDPARIARAARAREPLREARMAAPLGDHAVADAGGRPAGGHGARASSRPSSPARCSSTSADPVAAWGGLRAFQAKLIERLAPARDDPHRGRGHRPHARRRRAHVGQLRRQAQHAVRRGLHRPARDERQGRDPLHDPVRAAGRRRRGRRAGVPRRRGRVGATPSAATRTCRRRSRPTPARASSASSGSARTSASTARSARSCSTRRSAAPSTSRSAAGTRRPAARTSPPSTGI